MTPETEAALHAHIACLTGQLTAVDIVQSVLVMTLKGMDERVPELMRRLFDLRMDHAGNTDDMPEEFRMAYDKVIEGFQTGIAGGSR